LASASDHQSDDDDDDDDDADCDGLAYEPSAGCSCSVQLYDSSPHEDLGNSGGSSGGRRSAKARATLTCTLVNDVKDRGVKGCECIEAAVRPEWTLLLRVVACFLSLTHRVGRASSKGLFLHARREGRNAGLLWKPPAWRSSSSVPLAAFLAIDGQTFA
jgi:hypothetical protein